MSKEQLEEMRQDLIEIFDEEYEKRRVITADFTAEKMSAKGYRKQSEWISVDERLPELYTSVLVYCDAMVSKFYCVSEMIEPYGKRWSAVCGFRVTHWMPLPEAPRKEDEGK